MKEKLFCPVCRNVMKHTPRGLVCKNPNCSSRKYQVGDFVRHRKNPRYGVGRILEVLKKEHYKVEFKSDSEDIYIESLERYVLSNGTMVKTSFGQGLIAGKLMLSGEFYYKVLFPTGIKTIKEEMIDTILPANPIEKMKSGDIDEPSQFTLKMLARFYQIAQYSEDLVCIRNSRVDLIPHQVGVTHRVTQEYSPRFILADEVGLGKTMEAGLILKELKARGLVDRTLIVTPASLVTQWQHEMKSKFNERFDIFNSKSEAVYEASNPDQNVFSMFDNVLCSIHYAKRRVEDFSNQFWDLIIFDEAHHIRRKMIGKKIQYTKNYRFAEALKDRCSSMLLLTATPMQLDPYEFYSLIELLDPTIFKYYDLFQWYNDQFVPALKKILSELKSRGREFRNDKNYVKLLEQVIEFGLKYFPLTNLREGVTSDNIIDLLETEVGRVKIEKQLKNFFLVPKIMIRNRKREVFKHLPKRVVNTIGVDYTDEEIGLYNEISEYVRNEYNKALREKQTALGFVMVIFQKMLTSSRYALLKSFRKRLEAMKSETSVSIDDEDIEEFDDLDELEQQALLKKLLSIEAKKEEIQTLEKLCEKIKLIDYDSKLDAAMKVIDTILEEKPEEKILIFTQFIGTQEYLRDRLSKKYHVVIFNGQMSMEEKDKTAIKFKESAQIMISTEAGGEGRNFQFAHIMINYDLPWNPMRVEQRIGRLDRIGQKKKVIVYNFATIDTVEQRVLDVLYARIEKFRQIIGEIEPILGDIEKDVKKIVMSQKKDLSEEIGRLEKSIDEKLKDAKKIQKKIDDFLMDTRQFNFETVDQILGKKPVISPEDLKSFVKVAVLNLGSTAKFELVSPKVIKICLPLKFRRNKCRQREYIGTFDRNVAKEEEKLEFFAFGHELVSDLLWHYAGTESESVCTCIENTIDNVSGYLFFYSIEIEGLSNRKKFLPVFIDHSYHYDVTFSRKMFENIKNYLDIDGEQKVDDLGNIDECVGKSDIIVAEYMEKELEQIKATQNELFKKEINKLKLLFQLRRSKFDDELKKEKEQILRIKNFGDEKQKRIIPALEGRVKKIEERIVNLEEEKKDRLLKLREKEKITSNYSLLGVAKIVPVQKDVNYLSA